MNPTCEDFNDGFGAGGLLSGNSLTVPGKDLTISAIDMLGDTDGSNESLYLDYFPSSVIALGHFTNNACTRVDFTASSLTKPVTAIKFDLYMTYFDYRPVSNVIGQLIVYDTQFNPIATHQLSGTYYGTEIGIISSSTSLPIGRIEFCHIDPIEAVFEALDNICFGETVATSTSPSSRPSVGPSASNEPSSPPSNLPSTSPSREPSSSPTSEYCQDYLLQPLLNQYHCGDKYVGEKVPVCIAEYKKLKKSKKNYADALDPDGDGYYTAYETKCMKIEDIEELALGGGSKKSGDNKYIESCGCCASGLEDEHSHYCHNVFFHGDDGINGGQPSMAPSMAPASASPTTSSGKLSKRKKLRRRKTKVRNNSQQ